jgi:putative N6-adenine-specific DNA methylase
MLGRARTEGDATAARFVTEFAAVGDINVRLAFRRFSWSQTLAWASLRDFREPAAKGAKLRPRRESSLPDEQRIFGACAPGLERVLADELTALGLRAAAARGGVEAWGEDALALACIGSRVAEAVALRVFAGPENGLPAAVAAARRRFGAKAELAVRRERGLATVSLDAVGEPLFRRGWRARVGAAPLRESLAAGMLLHAGYDGSEAFLDPMCGSGTLALEAACIAAQRAPGLDRRFAFEQWPGHDASAAAAVRARLAARRHAPPAPVHASDRNAGALRLARKNAIAAGLDALIHFERRDAAAVTPPARSGLLAVNPPYGVRMAEDAAAAWRALASLLEQLPGWRAVVLAPDRGLERLLPRRPERVVRVRNGGLACRILVFAGS